ncbi:hypothetical protein J3E68DRAFT_390544 [Trichoderma sp. SZMC 28012]
MAQVSPRSCRLLASGSSSSLTNERRDNLTMIDPHHPYQLVERLSRHMAQAELPRGISSRPTHRPHTGWHHHSEGLVQLRSYWSLRSYCIL